ncbi:MAG: DUF3467 domain-containing protein [Chitinophagaceae bacterium]
MSNEKNKEVNNQINIEINEEIAEGIYSNLAMITHSSAEFIFDFINVMPAMPKSKVKARIITTPQHAKKFMMALADNINKYEETHGTIKEDAIPDVALSIVSPTLEA